MKLTIKILSILVLIMGVIGVVSASTMNNYASIIFSLLLIIQPALILNYIEKDKNYDIHN